MKARSIIIILLITLLFITCVPAYQRYIKGVYAGSDSSELFTALDELVKGNGFTFVRTIEKPLRYTISADYERYDDSIQEKVYLMIFLKDVDEGKGQVEFLITLNVLGTEKPKKKAVDKDFEDLVKKIRSHFEESKLKITKVS